MISLEKKQSAQEQAPPAPKGPDLRIVRAPSEADVRGQTALVHERIGKMQDLFAETEYVEELSQDLLEDADDEQQGELPQTPEEQYQEAMKEYIAAQEALARLAQERNLWKGHEIAGGRVLAQNAEEADGWNLLLRASERRLGELSQEMVANDHKQEMGVQEETQKIHTRERVARSLDELKATDQALKEVSNAIADEERKNAPTVQRLSELMLASGNHQAEITRHQAEITRLQSAGTVSGWKRAFSWVKNSPQERVNEENLANVMREQKLVELEQKLVQREMNGIFQTMGQQNKVLDGLFTKKDALDSQRKRLEEDIERG